MDLVFMRMALEEAKKCKPVSSAFNVGAVLVRDGQVLSTGYSRELEGNTHAEQVCLIKHPDASGCTIYSTMEPCGKRSVGNLPCAQRIIEHKISRVVQAAIEPETFVGESIGTHLLVEAGIIVDTIQELQQEALEL
ncbi:diaminohydroxyphosphoribosylamino-pyrimidine deaminase, partial [Gorgonomyces haynaldii]